MHHRFFFKMDQAGGQTGGGGSSSGGAQTGGSGASAGSTGGEGDKGGSGGAGDQTKVIKPEDHERALADLHKFKSDAKKAADALAAKEAELAEIRKNNLKAANDLKPYVEQLEGENKTLKDQIGTLKKGFGETFKSMELKAAAKKLGITDQGLQDLDLLRFDDVTTEFTTEGRVIVSGAEQAAETLKKTRPHWFQTGSAANINTGGKGGNSTPDALTTEYMNGLEKSDPKRYRELFPKYAKQLVAKK